MSAPVLVAEAPPAAWASTPYAVAFSPDGRTVAIGVGGWYGAGCLCVVDVTTGTGTTSRFVVDGDSRRLVTGGGDDSPLTVSGLAFDGSGEHLVASTWESRQHVGPAFLLRARPEPELLRTFELADDDLDRRCPTGVCLSAGHLYVRCNTRSLPDVLACFALPEAVDTEATFAHRSHARLARCGGELVTGGGGSLKLGGIDLRTGPYASFEATTGLVVGPTIRTIAAPGERITAVLAHPTGRLLTGGLTGEIVAWERQADDWRPTQWIRDVTTRPRTVGGAWATYRTESVVGLCALEDGRFFSVDASGEVLEWRDDRVTRTFPLPRPGTPRCIAVHPSTPRGPLLAVGVKVEARPRRGYVACFALG